MGILDCLIDKDNGKPKSDMEYIYRLERLQASYSWALAENTPENVERIKIYDYEYLKFKEYERKINSLRNNIITLKERGEKRKEKDITDEPSIEEQM